MCCLWKSQCKGVSVWETRIYISNPCHAVGSKCVGKKIKVADVVVSTNHVTFRTIRFPRLISLPTSAIFVLGTSGITAILKYRGVNPIYIYMYIYIFIYYLFPTLPQ